MITETTNITRLRTYEKMILDTGAGSVDDDDFIGFTEHIQQFVYISTDNEGRYAAQGADAIVDVLNRAGEDVGQTCKYAWWPMWILDLDKAERHDIAVSIDVKAVVTA